MPNEDRLRPFDRAVIVGLLAALVAFGFLVQHRSVNLTTRKTDIGVYLRAGYAARTGGDIYTAVDNNGWHYSYPPLLAILMIPFADAPTGTEQPSPAFPYAASVVLGYLIGVLSLFAALHLLASVLEETGWPGYLCRYPKFSQPWWGLRIWPMVICLPAIGSSLSRGQINTVVLLTIAGFAADTIRGRRGRAGLWLALGACLKLIPIFLILVPLMRREGRTLGFTALGIFIGLGVFPALVMGPEWAWQANRTFVAQTILPGFGLPGNGALARDLTDMNCTDNQSIQGILHNIRHWSETPRPAAADRTTKLLFLGVAGLLTAATFRSRSRRPLGTLLLIANLTLVMVVVCPVSHHHYFCLAVPLALALVARDMQRRESPALGSGMKAIFASQILFAALPKFPGLEFLRDAGVTLQGGLLLWLAGVVAQRDPAEVRTGKLVEEITAEPEAIQSLRRAA